MSLPTQLMTALRSAMPPNNRSRQKLSPLLKRH